MTHAAVSPAERQREALRQRQLLRVLWRDADAGALQGQARAPGAHALRDGVAAYRGNAGAVAERALAGAFPTVAELVGADNFGALARVFWSQQPPQRGDLGEWGAALADFIAASPQLADEAYLADVARLDWQVHRATRAADGPSDAPLLEALATTAPERVQLALVPGRALLASDWPVATIWLAHRRPAEDPQRFADVKAAFAAQCRETAFVWRDGLAVCVAALDPPAAAFVQALLARRSLAAALDAAGPDFTFDRWLANALRTRQLAAIRNLE